MGLLLKVRRGFTIVELLVVIAIISVLAGLIMPALLRSRQEARKASCRNQLMQIGDGAIMYAGSYKGQWPHDSFVYNPDDDCGGWAQDEYASCGNFPDCSGTTCSSYAGVPFSNQLAMLYPAYLDNARVFSCPSTDDRAFIHTDWLEGGRWAWFNNPAVETIPHPRYGDLNAREGRYQTSYCYDGLSSPMHTEASHVLLGDASLLADVEMVGSGHPEELSVDLADGRLDGYLSVMYGDTSTEEPTKHANHEGGFNLIYYDGHGKWSETPYASNDRQDHVFVCQDTAYAGMGYGEWEDDTDSNLRRTND